MRTISVRIFFVEEILYMKLNEFKRSPESEKPHYLLFGHPVEHSWSPLMHNKALQYYEMEATYHAVDLQNSELAELAAFLNKDTFLGANITIPYKQVIADYVDHIDQKADKIGAINTIVKNNYSIEGYNTDYEGFLSPLKDSENDLIGSNAIIFGTGGASKAIVVALVEMGIEELFLVSRTPGRISSFGDFEQVKIISYHEWTSVVDEALLIVNATPLGMHPNIDRSPVRDSEIQFLEGRICYDIVYNPTETKFLKQAKQTETTTISGLEMLIQQGSRSFELWTGHSFPTEIIRSTLDERLNN